MLNQEEVNRRYKMLKLCIAEFSDPIVVGYIKYLLKPLIESHTECLNKIETELKN